MDDINAHPTEGIDAIKFHYGPDAPMCSCNHRDPVLINHPASKTVFWVCKSCGDRVKKNQIGTTMWTDGGVAEWGRGAYVDDSGYHPGTNDMGKVLGTPEYARAIRARMRGPAGNSAIGPTHLKKGEYAQGVAMLVNGQWVDAEEHDYSSITRDNRRRRLKSRILFFGIIGATIIVILIGG